MTTGKDFTPSGLCVIGTYENDRNAENAELFKAIIREAFGVTDVIVAHHLTYVKVDKRADGFDYQVVEEIPSADALIFSHDIAQRIWGDGWRGILQTLALEPVATRDTLLASLYYGRKGKAVANEAA